MSENETSWTKKRVSQFTEKFDKSVGNLKKTIFLKSEGTAGAAHPGFGDVEAEYRAYVRLRPYLHMPGVRLLERGGQGKYLAVQNIIGTPLNELLKQGKLEEFQKAFRGFTSDLVDMWGNTLQPMDENQLVPGRDIHLRCLRRVETLRQNGPLKEILNESIVINGMNYPSLVEILNHSERFLLDHKEPIMSYTHGDESLSNIISTPGEASEYMAIDPQSAADGYYTPAQSANYLIGYTFLYDYEWSSSEMQKYDDHVEINYKIAEEFKDKDGMLRKLFIEFVEKLGTLGPLGKDMLREYLFSNLMRSYIGEVMPVNLPKVAPHKIAHLALAIELVTNFDSCLREPSYSSVRN
jgi:hypothetical protein